MAVVISQQTEDLKRRLPKVKVKWFHRQLYNWGSQHLRSFPWRNTSSPYPIFVAEFLLQKTKAETIVPVYKTFLERYPNLEDLAQASTEEVGNLLQPLGLHFRTERLLLSANIVREKYQGKIPDREARLLELPGIGKYTARSICAHAFGQPLAVLDTNVARILEKFFSLKGNRIKSRCKLLWKAAEQVAPSTEVSRWNLTLLDFGAAVCTASNPLCSKCPLLNKCNYARTNLNNK